MTLPETASDSAATVPRGPAGPEGKRRSSVAALAKAFAGGVSRPFRAWHRRLLLERELGRFSGQNLDRALADIGLNRAMLPALLKSDPGSGRRLARMLERIGLRAVVERCGPVAWRDVERTCATCPKTAKCERWLRRGEPADGYRGFCPNAVTFDLIAETDRAAAAKTRETAA